MKGARAVAARTGVRAETPAARLGAETSRAGVVQDHSEPLYVDLMTRRQKWFYRSLVCLWLAGLAYFWTWWIRPEHVITPIGMVLTSSMLLWSTGLPAWYFFFAGRAKRPNPSRPIPEGRVAMVVTKAPSEPWSLARNTLEHMLDQDFPHPYDVWLADEDPDDMTRDWCVQHGVRISCRRGVPEYQNPEFPGRERCKEGNLRYFYEQIAYATYRFVAQMDIDHAPGRSYLSNVIRPFSDPKVGYVAAPSICDVNAAGSWSCRARLYMEAPLHGVLQAGYNDGWAPNPIGSHYAVRVEALRTLVHRDYRGRTVVGGLGPELAEDHSTGLAMNAAGWRGAFAIDAIAHGEGAFNIGDSVLQEFQWSRSLINILLRWTPGYWPGLAPRLRLQYLFSQLWYPLFGLYMLGIYALPVMALVGGSPWVDVHYLDFLLHFIPVTLACLPPMFWLRRQGWLRPANARVIGWEAILFQFVRWPWILYAFVEAVVGRLLQKEFSFRITPKRLDSRVPLPGWMMLPYLLLTAGEAGVALLVEANESKGYYYLTVVYALAYALICVVLVALHTREARQRFGVTVRLVYKPSLAALAVLLLACSAAAVRGPDALIVFDPHATTLGSGGPADSPESSVPADIWRSIVQLATRQPPVDPATLFSGPAEPFDIPRQGLAIGAYDPKGRMTEVNLKLEQWFVRQDDPELLARELLHARNRRIAFITVEPYPSPGQRTPELQAIVSGQKDQELAALARVVAAARPQVAVLRWGHEMELKDAYPWSGQDPALYREAYRHVVAAFRAAGADNVRWVWSPAGNKETPPYYPGSDVVDYVGISIFGDAGWDASFGQAPQSFSQLLTPKYNVVTRFGRPLIIAELGVSGGGRRQEEWLASAAHDIGSFPGFFAVAYFDDVNPRNKNMPTRPDWRLNPALYSHFIWSLGG